MLEILSMIFLAFGMLVYVTGIVGILRLPDVYNRLHAITKTSFIGVLSIILSGAVYYGYSPLSVKALAIALFLTITYPVAGHLLARAAYRTGVPMSEKTLHDEYRTLLKLTEEEKNQTA
ncbi:MAG: monovalent cation/H(+) antiporter subunit G [Candidatus Caldarchaeum sp.]|nr:monovalent cation/H(+) antiporter subunit G [Candidatus Caldarchaeum sp.]